MDRERRYVLRDLDHARAASMALRREGYTNAFEPSLADITFTIIVRVPLGEEARIGEIVQRIDPAARELA
jgi:hypothetical protein